MNRVDSRILELAARNNIECEAEIDPDGSVWVWLEGADATLTFPLATYDTETVLSDMIQVFSL